MPPVYDDECRELPQATALGKVGTRLEVDASNVKRLVVSTPLQDLCEEAFDASRRTGLSAEEEEELRSDDAAKRGIFAHITDNDPVELQSTLDIVLRRFAEYHNLEGAFARRAVIEQAKGILIATHSIDAERAFEMLRTQSQQSGVKLLDLADAVVQGDRLLAPPKPPRQKD